MNNLYGDHFSEIAEINKYYSIYEGDQSWPTTSGLDYCPTKKVTNYIKKIINKRARFMFGIEPFFDIRAIEGASEDKAQEQEDLLKEILQDNSFHSKVLKAYKDSLVGKRVGIKLWASQEDGVRIVFVPSQEYFINYSEDDIDKIESVVIMYMTKDSNIQSEQRWFRQEYKMINNTCVIDEAMFNGNGEKIKDILVEHDTSLDFIPFISVVNGGLTGDIKGVSAVKEIWDSQDQYNKVVSDNIDALKFQMFGQTVLKDASESTIQNIKIAPNALIDLQTDIIGANENRSADAFRLESQFSYGDQMKSTIDLLRNEMYDLLDVPNVSLSELQGVITSGKSLKALYWDLMSSCDEDWSEWSDKLEVMVDYIFRMVDTYALYNAKSFISSDYTLEIEHYYPIKDDELDEKKVDLEEVKTEVRSRQSYMDKWGNYESVESELDKIKIEKQTLDLDSFSRMILDDDKEGLYLDV